jgi:Domain of unknown function (DUF4304)
MDPYERFHDLLKRDFAPLLRGDGFKGSGTTFRRITGEVIQVVNIQCSKYGGQCCVNLGLHYSFLPTAGGDQVTDPKKVKDYQCDFRDRIHEAHESDHWWTYGTTAAESEASVANLIDTYRRRGASFFKKFEPFPDVFEKITPADLDAGDRSKLPTEMTQLHAAITIARIMQHLGRTDQCRRFAEVGLRHLGRAVGLKPELERLRDAG